MSSGKKTTQGREHLTDRFQRKSESRKNRTKFEVNSSEKSNTSRKSSNSKNISKNEIGQQSFFKCKRKTLKNENREVRTIQITKSNKRYEQRKIHEHLTEKKNDSRRIYMRLQKNNRLNLLWSIVRTETQVCRKTKI